LHSKVGFFSGKSRGNIESLISILPQVAIFLLSLQLITMQLSQSTTSYIDRKEFYVDEGKSNPSSLRSKAHTKFEDIELMGGGKVRTATIYKEHPTLIAFFTNLTSKSVSVEVDERSIN
jgi:hypothetical protein